MISLIERYVVVSNRDLMYQNKSKKMDGERWKLLIL